MLPIASECLPHREVELASASHVRPCGSVESPTPVESEESDDGQVEPYAQTRRTLDLEWRKLFPRSESVTSLEESQNIDLRRLLEYNGITQFHSIFVVRQRVIAAHGIERAVLVTAQTDDVHAIDRVTAHTVASDLESLERREFVLIVMSEETHLGVSHQHQILVAGERLEPTGL